jgi:hypothetical protein
VIKPSFAPDGRLSGPPSGGDVDGPGLKPKAPRELNCVAAMSATMDVKELKACRICKHGQSQPILGTTPPRLTLFTLPSARSFDSACGRFWREQDAACATKWGRTAT